MSKQLSTKISKQKLRKAVNHSLTNVVESIMGLGDVLGVVNDVMTDEESSEMAKLTAARIALHQHELARNYMDKHKGRKEDLSKYTDQDLDEILKNAETFKTIEVEQQ